jgi:hypothetical protein
MFEVCAVDGAQASACASRDDEQCAMVTCAPRRFVVGAVFGAGRQFDQTQFRRAAERAQLPAHAVCGGKGRVKERQPLDAFVCDFDKTVQRLNAVEHERFKHGLHTELADFRCKPISSSFIAGCARAMNTVTVILLNPPRHPPFGLHGSRGSRKE